MDKSFGKSQAYDGQEISSPHAHSEVQRSDVCVDEGVSDGVTGDQWTSRKLPFATGRKRCISVLQFLTYNVGLFRRGKIMICVLTLALRFIEPHRLQTTI